ncbi:cardiolipin synthase [Planctomicrobium sp. SH664]|uniref:cardiolipin synthase n=1 Tax=Planctomicrobium sp. SH664 TaxID=3448125 RepID=UPI003F5C95FD
MKDPIFYWGLIFALLERALAIGTSLHAILTKRETQTVIGWVGLIWLSPFLGSLFYFCFGINRIERRGQRIERRRDRKFMEALRRGRFVDHDARQELPFRGTLFSVVSKITSKPLLTGNSVKLLVGGEQAYPAMLQAIDEAVRSVSLCSYIFDNDRAGQEFAAALVRARQRGVEVRVLVDDVGSRYSKPPITRVLRAKGIQTSTFLPTRVPRLAFYANLRNHRKLMVVDGRLGFAGGMNIREGCRLDWETSHPVQDIHFRFEGPVVSHIQETFVTDWAFATGEQLQGGDWFTTPDRRGQIRARGISDGPDSDIDNIRLVILAGLQAAEARIDIVTPYFLPDLAIVNALTLAAMRGVRVRILLPQENNILLVQWASMDPISNVLPSGCEIYLTAPPFDHTKVMLVDDDWSLIGSSNWDPRSLRLNFEFNIECYDRELNQQLTRLVEGKLQSARRMTIEDVKQRSLPVRLRDGLARMAIPYL